MTKNDGKKFGCFISFCIQGGEGVHHDLTLYYAGLAGSPNSPPYIAAKIPKFTEFKTDVFLFLK
jgi:hypothetical protein